MLTIVNIYFRKLHTCVYFTNTKKGAITKNAVILDTRNILTSDNNDKDISKNKIKVWGGQ